VDESVTAFVEEARRYCRRIESGGSDNTWVFARDCLACVLRLYGAALELPAREPEAVKSLDRIDHDDWERMMRHVGRRLARECYWEVFEPLERDRPEAICGSLSDDLADIWRDIKPGLLELDSPGEASVDDVVWQWRFSFESHWGHHAVGCIAALHAMCFGPLADGSRPQMERTNE
jgi:hypothetical protein